MSQTVKLTVSAKVVRKKPARKPNFFLGLFTVESWREFKRHGGQVMGFNEKKATTVGRLQPGDRILCYLSKVSAFVGVMEVTGPSYLDRTPIWSDGVFPVRLPVQVVVELPLAGAVPIRTLRGKLSFMPAKGTPTGWTVYVRSSPRRWSDRDAKVVVKAISSNASKGLGGLVQNARANVDPSTPAKYLKLPLTARVGRIIAKTARLSAIEEVGALGSYESALSFNKVTGYSVNVPIAETCRPTAMCMETCYFAAGAPSWSNALRHQRKVRASIQMNSAEFAERVAMEYDRLGLTFIRWNGGGDLFKESVDAVNHLAKMRPDIIIWVVTRIPEWAALVDQAPNVFVHFSLDKHSLSRRESFLKLKPRSLNYFFSYQCAEGEIPPLKNLKNVSVLFFDNYKPTTDLAGYPSDIICPLNTVADIAGVCETCRRCFNGAAVDHKPAHALQDC